MNPDRISGVMPVLYAFFDHNGGLRLDGFAHQTDHCLSQGATGVVLFGFVTQFYRLTFAEKVAAIRATVAEAQGRGHVGVTVMEPSWQAQAELIRVAREEGVDWVILQPPLGPPINPADWLAMLPPLIKGAGVPVAIQNADMANVQLATADLVTLQQSCPNLVAIKAETDSASVAAFAADHGTNFRVVIGNWGVEYPFFRRHGAAGLIPAPNFVPEQVAQEMAAARGDWASVDDLQAKILPLMQFIRERAAPEGQIQLGKAAYGWRTGFDPGHNRAPGPAAIDTRILAHAKHLWEWFAQAS